MHYLVCCISINNYPYVCSRIQVQSCYRHQIRTYDPDGSPSKRDSDVRNYVVPHIPPPCVYYPHVSKCSQLIKFHLSGVPSVPCTGRPTRHFVNLPSSSSPNLVSCKPDFYNPKLPCLQPENVPR